MNDNIIPESKNEKKKSSLLVGIYDIVETLAFVTVFVMIVFAFVVRLNIVSGISMNNTLYGGEMTAGGKYTGGEWLLVSDVLYEPTPGDIVVLHDVSAYPYNEPLVKRVIAVGGQTVDIDELTGTLIVDGKTVDESAYVHYEGTNRVLSHLSYPLTLEENEVFVMGDNRNNSADSRIIGPVDKRCIIGKALMRIFPFNKITVFKNPYSE